MSRTFFAAPPKAERAFLSAYKAEVLRGRYGIRIELEPLLFVNQSESRELEPEIHLCHLVLPSIVPIEIQNTRYVPNPDPSPPFRYEGSCYFLGEYNWVDLNEIRFFDVTDDIVLAEYHLNIHLPEAPPNEYPLVLSARTKIESGVFIPETPRQVPALGTFVETRKDLWECNGTYHGNAVQVELSADFESFEKIAAYARAVIADNAITPSDLRHHIKSWLGLLEEKLDRFNVKVPIRPDEFGARSFYFYQRRHHDEPEVIIVLDNPANVGHWSISFTGTNGSDMNWTPNALLNP